MKRLFAILLSITLATISLGQEITRQQNSHLEPEKLMFSDNDKLDYKAIGYSNDRQLKKTTNNSIFDAKQKLDSLIIMMNYEDINTWTLTNKHEYSYDEYGNTAIIIRNGWDSDINDWIPDHKTDKFFNGFNKPFLEIENYWQVDSNQWVPFEKYEYEYYEDGNIRMEKFTEKDYSSNNWISKWKTDFNYDINNQLQSKVYSTWMIDSNTLITYKTEEFTYNSFGKLNTYVEKRLNLNTLFWVDMNKSIYTYNTSNQDSMILFLKFDYATDSLLNYARRKKFYNSNGFDKIDLLAYWDKIQNQWRFDSKEESNYDSSGKKIFLIRSLWYNDLGWHKINKRQFVYDNNENLNIYQFYTPTDSSDWLLKIEYDYNYDYNYTISECYFPTFESYPIEYINHMNNKPTDYVILNENDGELYEEDRIIYYYSDLNIGISEEMTKEFVVYPNPTNGKLLVLNDTGIKLYKVRIYNQLGQLVMYKNKIPNSIDLSTLNEGFYIVEFESENMRIRRKIILK